MSNEASEEQPLPEGKGDYITDMVCADLKSRSELGRLRYGEYLRAFNGRKALVDAYQEILDLTQYMRQELEERERLFHMLMRVLDCFLDSEGTWFQGHWRKYGISVEEEMFIDTMFEEWKKEQKV